MKNLFLGLILLIFSTAKSQSDDKNKLKKILTDIMQDTSFNTSLAQINGMPSVINYLYKTDEKQVINVDRAAITKEYANSDNGVSVKIRSFKHLKKTSSEIAKIKLIFSDGTKASLRATNFSKNSPWHLTFYLLNGKNLEKGGRVVILKGEI